MDHYQSMIVFVDFQKEYPYNYLQPACGFLIESGGGNNINQWIITAHPSPILRLHEHYHLCAWYSSTRPKGETIKRFESPPKTKHTGCVRKSDFALCVSKT
jgi:hypothetical protein